MGRCFSSLFPRSSTCGPFKIIKTIMDDRLRFAIVFSLLSVGARTSEAATPLYFSFIVSFGRDGFNSSGTIPAVDLALELINNQTILPEYELRHTAVRDSKVS